jgi:hypothetical protein
LVGKPERKTAIGKPMRRRKYNIKRMLKKYSVRMWRGFNWFRTGPSVEIS